MAEKIEQEQEKQAWIVALRLLAATPKSRKNLFSKLSEKGFSESVVQKTLDGLEAKGLLSDKAYARDIVSKLVHGTPSGTRRISFELKRKGVPDKLRDEILSDLDPEQERERAREAAALKWERFKSLDPDKRKKRIYDFLMRRGFGFDLVRDIVEELENEKP